jgi:D-amino-acid dehydrogenase
MPLIQRSLIEHEALIAEANVPELLRRNGWIKLFRSEATLAGARGGAGACQAVWGCG